MRLAVLASGRGSNFAAIAEAVQKKELNAKVLALICNKPGAPVLEIARRHGIPTIELDSKAAFKDPKVGREGYEKTLLEKLEHLNPDYLCLTGYMLLLGKPIIAKFPNRILNIHPSLLPQFRGLNAQGQAVAAKAKESGCTVHLVNENLDDGPILVQKTVPVFPNDTAESLAQRILPEEHRAYVEALKKLSTKKHDIKNGRVVFY